MILDYIRTPFLGGHLYASIYGTHETATQWPGATDWSKSRNRIFYFHEVENCIIHYITLQSISED